MIMACVIYYCSKLGLKGLKLTGPAFFKEIVEQKLNSEV